MTMRKFITQDEQCTCNVTLRHVRVGTETQQYVPFILLLTYMYEGWNFNSGNYLFTTDTK